MEYVSCLKKQSLLKETFLALKSQEEKYHRVIEFGQAAPPMPPQDQLEENLVTGCQSRLYLKVECKKGRLALQASSDALISAGLAQLLIQIYDGEPPEAVFKCPPLFLKEIGLIEALSSSRASGLKSLYQKLQQESLKYLVSK